jgi:Ca2+-binding EF-hand superfamily protein
MYFTNLLHTEAVRDLSYTGWEASDADIEMFMFVNQAMKDGVVRVAPGVFNTAKPTGTKKSTQNTHSTNKLASEDKSVPLRTLDCSHCSLLSDASMQLVGHWCPSLCSLKMAHTAITDEGLESVLTRCRNLEVIDFSHCMHLTERSIGTITRFVQQQLLRGFLQDEPSAKRNIFDVDRTGSAEGGDQSIQKRRRKKKKKASGRGLRELRLAGCTRAVDDKNTLQLLRVLQESPSLGTVDLGSCDRLTDMSMYNCALPQGTMEQRRHPMRQSIRTLNLSGITCTSSGMEWIALACNGLQRLDLSQAKGSGLGFSLRLLSNRLPKLEELVLRGCVALSSSDMQQFFKTTSRGGTDRVEQAKALFESGEGGGEGGEGGGRGGLLLSLALSEQQMARSTLRKLDLCGCCMLDDMAVEALARCLAVAAGGQLEELSLEGVTNLHDRSLTALAHHCGARLTKLRIGGNVKYASAGAAGSKSSGGLYTRFSNAALAALGMHCKRLRHLHLAYSAKIDDRGMEALFGVNTRAGEGSLSKKNDQLVPVSPIATGQRAGGGVGGTLTELDISHCPYLGEAAAMAVGQFCPELVMLEATNVSGLTDRGMVVIVQQCPKIHSLFLAYCPLLTDLLLHAIARSPNGTCARLKVLCLGGLASAGPGGEGAGAGGGGDGQAGQITDEGFLSLTTHAKANLDAQQRVLKSKAAAKGVGWRAEMRAKEAAKVAAKKMFKGKGKWGKGLGHNNGTDASGMSVQHGPCLQLERLQLVGLRRITDATIDGLRECGCTSLTSLNLQGVHPVDCTPTAVVRLCSANPWTKIFVGNEPTTLGMVPLDRWVHPTVASSVPTMAPKAQAAGAGGEAKADTSSWECPTKAQVVHAMLKREQWRSAISIQCLYRCTIARMSTGALALARQKVREHAAATKVQTKKRSNDAWRKYGPLIQERARATMEAYRRDRLIFTSAVKIQARFKHWFYQRKMAVPTYEAMRADQIHRDRVNGAASFIQKRWRGYSTRVEYGPIFAMKYEAAIKIQGMIRGYQGRKHATEAVAMAVHRHKSATKIQLCFRFWFMRATMHWKAYDLRQAIIPIQATVRMHIARRQVSRIYLRRTAAAKLLRRSLLPLMVRWRWRQRVKAMRLYEGRVARYKLGPWFERRKVEMAAWKAAARKRVHIATNAKTIQQKFAWPIILATRLALKVQPAWRCWQARNLARKVRERVAWEQYRKLAQNPIVMQGACMLIQAWWNPKFKRHCAARLLQYNWRTSVFIKAEKARQAEILAAQENNDGYYAMVVQARWRGFWLRKSRFAKRRKAEIRSYEAIHNTKVAKLAVQTKKRLEYREVFFKEYAVKKVQRHFRHWLDTRPKPTLDIRNHVAVVRKGIVKAPKGAARMHANYKRDKAVKKEQKARIKAAMKDLRAKQRKDDMLGLRKKEKIPMLKFDPEEMDSAFYSVAYRQNKVLDGSGVVDIWLTVGQEEAHSFHLAQKERAKLGKPVFHKIDVDLLEKPLGSLKRPRGIAHMTKRQMMLHKEKEEVHEQEMAVMADSSLPEQYQAEWLEKQKQREAEIKGDMREVTQIPKKAFLWVAHGQGLDCIVELQLRKRVCKGQAAQIDHKRRVKSKGYTVRWQMVQHYTCALEINYKNKYSHYQGTKSKHSSTAGVSASKATEIMKFEKRQGNGYFDGSVSVDDAADAIGNKGPGAEVRDMRSAPGGKSTVLQAVAQKDERMPILNIAISKGRQDEARLINLGFEPAEHEKGGCDLGELGCEPGAKLWVQKRKPKLTLSLHRALKELEKEKWFDHNVKEAVTFLAMSRENILDMKAIFDQIDVTGAKVIDIGEFFYWLDVERSAWGDDFFGLFDEKNSGVVNFGEWVHAMTSLCMMEAPQILRFIFHMMDKTTEGRITQQQFDSCMTRLGRDSAMINVPMIIHRGGHYFNKAKVVAQGGYMSYEDFHEMICNFPTVHVPVDELRSLMCDCVMGLPFWTHKKELFAEARNTIKQKDKEAKFQIQSKGDSIRSTEGAEAAKTKEEAFTNEGESEGHSQQEWLYPPPPPPAPDEEEGLIRGAKIGHLAQPGNAAVHARIVGLKADMYGDGEVGHSK